MQLEVRSACWSWLQIADACIVWRYLMLIQLRNSGSLLVWGKAAPLRDAAADIRERATQAQLTQAQAEHDTFAAFLQTEQYLSQRMASGFRTQNKTLFEQAPRRARLIAQHDPKLSAQLLYCSEQFDACVRQHNQDWIAKEEVQWAKLFDEVERTPLTGEQRKAVIVFDDRNLLVAAAGSGKSSTVVAKVAYALSAGLYRPEEVLVLTFNRKAALEIQARLRSRLGTLTDVKSLTALTFDALARRILTDAPAIELDPKRRIKEVYRDLRTQDDAFAEACSRFIVLYTPDLRSRADFESYEAYLDYARACDMRPKTLNGEIVASMEELKIANWLFIRGVAYEYEKSYPHAPSKEGRRGYTPDFYYPDIDAWHEHFGVDAQGKPAPCVGEPDKYLDSMRWKRGLHAAHRSHLIETTSAMFRGGHVFEHLETELRARGQSMRVLSAEEIDKKLAQDDHDKFAELISDFFASWKQRRPRLSELAASEDATARDRAFLAIAQRVFKAYESSCRAARKRDFADVMVMATSAAAQGHYRSPFRFILVDEFQDMSALRADLVRALLAQHEDCVLFGVGDDWQAINGFAGSEVSFMTNFERAFGVYTEAYLTQTFRSCQGIADAARTFIEKNPAQRKKSVSAADATMEDTVAVRVYKKRNELPDLYQQIARELTDVGPCTLQVLGRYKRNQQWDNEWPRLKSQLRTLAPNTQITHSTIHKAKGLEADFVIIDRVEERSSYAFPNNRSALDDSVLRLVRPTPEAFAHAEERRLMYVALTRARKRVYILTSESKRSKFVTELVPEVAPEPTELLQAQAPEKGAVSACPYCKRGTLVWREKRRFWGCNTYWLCPGAPPRQRD
jgi:DNA helicase-4